MIMKRPIFTTYGDTPIKNVKTPINRFDGDPDEEEPMVIPTTDITADERMETAISMLNSIRVLLFVLVILILICLIRK